MSRVSSGLTIYCISRIAQCILFNSSYDSNLSLDKKNLFPYFFLVTSRILLSNPNFTPNNNNKIKHLLQASSAKWLTPSKSLEFLCLPRRYDDGTKTFLRNISVDIAAWVLQLQRLSMSVVSQNIANRTKKKPHSKSSPYVKNIENVFVFVFYK